MDKELKNVSSNLPSILHESIRRMSEKEIFALIQDAYNNGDVSDEGLLRFYIACYKLNNVNKYIKEDESMKETIDNLALEFKGQNFDGKRISHGVTYTKNEFDNPIEDALRNTLKAFTEHNNLKELQKGIPQGTSISINLDTKELGEKILAIGQELIDMDGATVDLQSVVKLQTFGIRLTNSK